MTDKLSERPSMSTEKADLAELRKALIEARAANERDRSIVYIAITALDKELAGRDWLRESRGSYEWNDDTWHGEFAAASDAIVLATEPLRKMKNDLTDCPPTQAEANVIRGLVERAEKAEAKLAALLRPQGETPEGGRPVVVASGDKELMHWANMGGAPIIINGVQLMCESNPRDVHKIYGSSHTSKKTMKPICLVHTLHESECEVRELEAKLAASLPPSEPVSPQPQACTCDCHKVGAPRGCIGCWGFHMKSVSESPLPGRDAQEGSRTIVGLADDLAEALYTVIAAIPKQTEDADWWQDDLSAAVREANKLLAEYTAFPDAPQLPVRPEDALLREALAFIWSSCESIAAAKITARKALGITPKMEAEQSAAFAEFWAKQFPEQSPAAPREEGRNAIQD